MNRKFHVCSKFFEVVFYITLNTLQIDMYGSMVPSNMLQFLMLRYVRVENRHNTYFTWSDISRYWMHVGETCHKYLSCLWELLQRFSGQTSLV